MYRTTRRRTLVPASRADPLRRAGQNSRHGGGGTMSSATATGTAWGADFFGTLNELPSEPIEAIAQILEVMRTEPAFQSARRAMLADLQVGPGGRLLDAG